MDEALKTFMDYVNGALLNEMTDILYEQIAASITGLTREQALRIAREQAAALVTNITKDMESNLRKLIEHGLADQIGVPALARMIEEGLMLDSGRQATLEAFKKDLELNGVLPGTPEYEDAVAKEFASLVRDRAETIAATEMRAAIESGEQTVATERGATHKIWMTVSDQAICEICEGNEAQGPIPINDAFESGDDAPPAHPNCRCTATYFTDTGAGELDVFTEFAKEQAALTAAAREAATTAEE